jgi:hypothetical protein
MGWGWDVRETQGSDDVGNLRIERDDELGVYPNDQAAWMHVVGMAMAGSASELADLKKVVQDNPSEREAILEHLRKAVTWMEEL